VETGNQLSPRWWIIALKNSLWIYCNNICKTIDLNKKKYIILYVMRALSLHQQAKTTVIRSISRKIDVVSASSAKHRQGSGSEQVYFSEKETLKDYMPRSLECNEITSGFSRSSVLRAMNNDIIFKDASSRNFSLTIDVLKFPTDFTNRKLMMGCINLSDTVFPFFVFSLASSQNFTQSIQKYISMFNILLNLQIFHAGANAFNPLITSGMKSADKLLMVSKFTRRSTCCASVLA